MSKTTKLVIIIVLAVVIALILAVVNAFCGNPISQLLARGAVERYIAEKYAGTDYVIDSVNYNLKISGYSAQVKSPSSIDTHFDVQTSMLGEVRSDWYEEVTNGWNTYRRVDEEYRELVETVFAAEDFPLKSQIDFGAIEVYDRELVGEEPAFGVAMDELVLDKQYDVRELAKTTGYIVYYAYDDEISTSRAAELMLALKQRLDDAGIPFYSIDFELYRALDDSGKPDPDGESIAVEHFLYSDIYPEGLEQRIQSAHEKRNAHYAELDAQKNAEMIG